MWGGCECSLAAGADVAVGSALCDGFVGLLGIKRLLNSQVWELGIWLWASVAGERNAVGLILSFACIRVTAVRDCMLWCVVLSPSRSGLCLRQACERSASGRNRKIHPVLVWRQSLENYRTSVVGFFPALLW